MLSNIQTHWHPFDAVPASDSCWAVATGPDGAVYAAACCEYRPGGTVMLMRFDPESGCFVPVLDLARAVDDLPESGRASQCKIHYSLLASRREPILYMATHVSAPPLGRAAYSAWTDWHAPHAFRGAALAAWDVRSGETLWWETLYPREGCRCMCLDEERGLIYSISYPRDHLFVFDLATRRSRDLGRIGSVNAQALVLDSRGRVWTTSDAGHLVCYDPARDRLIHTPTRLPHAPAPQTGWHSVLYDAIADPCEPSIWAVAWNAGPRMVRLWLDEGEWGRAEDLGPLTQPVSPAFPISSGLDHVGGLTFGPDGMLYYVAARWGEALKDAPPLSDGTPRDRQAELWRWDPATGEREPLATLDRPEATSHYISRGALAANGDLFFAACLTPAPVGCFRISGLFPDAPQPLEPELRRWG